MKHVIMSPGWTESNTWPSYIAVAETFRARGFNVTALELDWDKRNITSWASQIVEAAGKLNGETSLWGFSLGAMSSLIAASFVPVNNLILCSPSGFFREYFEVIPDKSWEWLGSKHKERRELLSWRDLLGSLKVDHGFTIAGEKELSLWPEFKLWTAELVGATGWDFIKVAGAGHDIGNKHYERAIKELINSLN
ncbi:MAG: hypothetical protein ACHQUB_01955 [Candidatus Saccharimonadia bacterium]